MSLLAHWTITQRTIRVILTKKTKDSRQKELRQAGTVGAAICTAHLQSGLSRETIAEATGIPVYWLGRFERNRCSPTEAQWSRLQATLQLGLPVSGG
jgi:ribosome-binding protein aMBF1 (putative translation factor)